VNPLFRLKLLLIRYGKCTACLDDRKVKYCGRCLNSRLEPDVVEAITVLDLAAKFEENENRIFESISEDDYIDPPRHSYFARVKAKKSKFEALYRQLNETHNEQEIYRQLMREVFN
jgi:hypothetical protein